MSAPRTAALSKRMVDLDLGLCLLFNRGAHRDRVRQLFATVSRLGDGVFWYALMAVLPLLYGSAGFRASARMLLAGVAGVVIYKAVKARFVRERPFVAHPAIRLGTPPLDRFSFPSGHTLHAVAFTLVVLHHFPEWAPLLLPFALLVAASRMVLGLHYPSDVIMGAAIGAGLALISVHLPF